MAFVVVLSETEKGERVGEGTGKRDTAQKQVCVHMSSCVFVCVCGRLVGVEEIS